ncbi:MAG: hypothetical protein KGN36_12535 [Acidobacteriota bacterium]|nr:hypothetical protein [Acidobacteriota bacterium]
MRTRTNLLVVFLVSLAIPPVVAVFAAGPVAPAPGSLADCVRSDPSNDPIKETLLKPTLAAVARVAEQIPTWQSAAVRYRIIAVAIFLIGLLTSALSRVSVCAPEPAAAPDAEPPPHPGPPKHAALVANAVFVLGLVVSGLTTWLNQGFATDRKGYLKSVDAAANKICEIQTQINLFRAQSFETLPDELSFISKNIAPLNQDLSSIQDPLLAYVPLPSATAYAQSRNAAQYAVQTVTGYGNGACTYLPQAQENARQEALDSLVASLAARLTLDPSGADRLILRNYAARYGSRSERQMSGKAADLRYIDATVSLIGTFADPEVVRLYLSRGEQDPPPTLDAEAIAAVRARFTRRNLRLAPPSGFLEGSAVLYPRAPNSGAEVVLSRPGAVRVPAFRFHFVLDRGARKQPGLTLDTVEVLDDGADGSAQWSFAVLVEGQIVISLPEQQWDDRGHPTRCIMGRAYSYGASLPPRSGEVRLTVVGMTPEALTQR